jgi:iron complex transport system substrate-binding protein
MLRWIRSTTRPPNIGMGSTSRPIRHLPSARLLVAIALITLAAAACGDEASTQADEPSTDGSSPFPVTVKAANGKVTVERRPDRIVSLSPTATEMLFAIGAGDQVVAADEFSNFPADAPTTKLSGLEPNVEAIAEYEPDLVIASDDVGGLGRSLETIEIPFLVAPAPQDLKGSYAQIEQLGAVTGTVANAAEVVATMQSEIDSLIESLPSFEEPPTYYHELDQNYFSVTSETFVGQIYELLGLENIADQAKGAASQYPQLSAEFIVDADPDLIFLADTKCCDQSAETVSARPGWEEITAVQNGDVIELNDDIASRWGPRVVDYMKSAAVAVSESQPVSG